MLRNHQLERLCNFQLENSWDKSTSRLHCICTYMLFY